MYHTRLIISLFQGLANVMRWERVGRCVAHLASEGQAVPQRQVLHEDKGLVGTPSPKEGDVRQRLR